MLLFFDTETTGLWKDNLPIGHDEQPRICQIAGVLTDEDGVEQMSLNLPVYQEVVPERAAAVHGKTAEVLARIGLNEGIVLSVFEEMLELAHTVVAHNGAYDQKVVMNALLRYDGVAKDPFRGKQAFCTMRAATPLCRIKSPRGGFKWPNLQEAHRHFFGHEFEGAHDAFADVKACRDIYFEMRRIIAERQSKQAG